MFGFAPPEDDEPCQGDVGQFIPQRDLEAWWAEMQRKHPSVFQKDDMCPQQVREGTAIRTYFDGDRNNEMKAVVVGSKFKNESYGDRYAMYVVRQPPTSPYLSFIHLTEVGEDDGWEVIAEDGAEDNTGCVALVGVDKELFVACFGKDDAWSPYKIITLDEDSTMGEIQKVLSDPGLKSVVVDLEEDDCYLSLVKEYYRKGGRVVWFGIYGEFAAPGLISKHFGCDWKFSAYTKHPYVLTEAGKDLLGDSVTEQDYSKANLLFVPEEDRVLVPKCESFKEYCEEYQGYYGGEDKSNPECDAEELEECRDSYRRRQSELGRQVPIALRTDQTTGGSIAYVGFVGSDGNTPKFFRAICCGQKVEA